MRKDALLLLWLLLLSACHPTPKAATPSPTPRPPATATPLPPATSTPRIRRLTLCTEGVQSLNPLAPDLPADLALLIQAPLARRIDYRWEPVLLAEMPSVQAGTIVTRMVPVPSGTPYVAPDGALRTNEGPLTYLPQMEVIFHLREGVRWSDGEPLTADDLLFTYHLAQEEGVSPHWQARVQRSVSLEAVDALTVRWIGVPGLLTAEPVTMLPPPLPAHRYRYQHWSEIASDREPLSLGPFILESWQEAGLRFHPNPNALEPPKLDEVVIRYLPADRRTWPSLLTDGTCDLLLPAQAMQIEWTSWATLAQSGAVMLWADVGPRPTFVQLTFNLRPQEGDAGALGELSVRQAIAACIDRTALVQALGGQALLPATTFVPPNHPAYLAPTPALPSAEAAQQQLDRLGWRDEDRDGIREAHGVVGLTEGTPLSFTLHLAPAYTLPAAHLAAALEECGIGIRPLTTDARLLYAPDAASPLFGRTFQLALFGWEADLPALCGTWLSERIPSEENGWQGENVSGYANAEYDKACLAALQAVDTEERDEALRRAEQRLAHDLPTLFLFWRPTWFVSSPRVEGIRPDFSSGAALWNISEIDVQEEGR